MVPARWPQDHVGLGLRNTHPPAKIKSASARQNVASRSWRERLRPISTGSVAEDLADAQAGVDASRSRLNAFADAVGNVRERPTVRRCGRRRESQHRSARPAALPGGTLRLQTIRPIVERSSAPRYSVPAIVTFMMRDRNDQEILRENLKEKLD
jgi:hypothetical protein